MSEFEETRAEQTVMYTPLTLVLKMLEEIENGNIENVIFGLVRDSGRIEFGYSAGNLLHYVGVLEAIKMDLLEDVAEANVDIED